MSPFILLESAPSSMLGNIIVVSGAFLILVFLIKKYAWGAVTSIFDERAKKSTKILITQKMRVYKLKLLQCNARLN